MDAEARYQRILKVLKLAIIARGVRQADLEHAIGRGHNYVSRVLTGRSELKVIDLLRAIDALGMDEKEVLGPLLLGPREGEGSEAAEPGSTPPGAQTDAEARGGRPNDSDR